MEFVSDLICFIVIFFNFLSLVTLYNENPTNYKLSKKMLLLIFVSSILSYYINIYMLTFKVILIFILIFINCLIIYKEKIIKCILKVLIMSLFFIILDFFLSFIILMFPLFEKSINEYASLFKVLITNLETIIVFLVAKKSSFYKLYKITFNKVCYYSKSIVIMLFSEFLLIINIIIYGYYINRNINKYIFTFTIVAIIIFILFIIIKEMIDKRKMTIERNTMLEMINEYERILEKIKKEKHEYLNNLIILKTFANKKTKKYEELVNSMIEQYNSKNNNILYYINKLPAGIKGMVYSKLIDVDTKETKVSLNISKRALNSLNELDYKTYYDVCELIGICMDNSVEAIQKSNEKRINFDIYNDNNIIIIIIQNTYYGEINIEKVRNKGYSSKGKNRGYGLYIASSIISKNENIDFEILNNNGLFEVIIKIKNAK